VSTAWNQRQPVRLIPGSTEERGAMLKWAVVFLIIALIAGLLGFTDVQIVSAGIAKFLFAIFLIGFLLIVLFGFLLGSRVARGP
jgi:uncharacterized membrane protein YtjA (UPF0391 family)